jgi:hypothetical protein
MAGSEKRRQIRLKTEVGGDVASASAAVFMSDDSAPAAVTMMWLRRLSYGCVGGETAWPSSCFT